MVQIYMRTNTPFSGSCTVMNPPNSVQSKTVSGHIEDMTLLMETSDFDYIYTDTFKIHCKFEIFHTITNKAIHMNVLPSTVYSEVVNFEDLTLDQFEPENGDSITFIIDKEQHVIPKKLLYATNSNYFKNICLTYKEDKKELTNELTRNNEVQAFKYLLSFITNGSIKQVQDDYDMLKKLLITADRYDVSALKLTCEHYLLRYITIENVVELIKLASSSNAKFLESHSSTFFKLYKNDITNTKKFQNLSSEDSCKIMELIENSKICETSTPQFSLTPNCEKY
ncbi:PREDICTED: BTB/POZ and MATH domain-containing protein 5-like isoform X3 [Wasmannia auropunctata]|nr:PREDICTED: BTB/POZ and MATH domain-containing protein 5-like isoform X3 [Wasmannia auropunctata]